MEIKIRTATLKDAESLLNIYRPYVESTAVSFENSVPTKEEFIQRMENIQKKYPYLVAMDDKEIVGYAYAGAYKDRAAYDLSTEITVYMRIDSRGLGGGKALYTELEKRLSDMGIRNMYACVAYPEEEDEYLTKDSVAFHNKMGFAQVGRFHKCGHKFGHWYDVVWMEKIIGEHA